MQTAPRKPWKGPGMEGRVARWYTRTRSNDMEEFRQQAKAIARQLQAGCRVLEVAPGPGFFAIELAKLGEFTITGLDVSRTFVAIATDTARKGGVSVDFRLGNASAMPFADESFDFVYCSAAFKNFSEPVKALDEMYRVLRPSTTAVIVDLRKDLSSEAIDSYVRQSGRKAVDAWLTKWTFKHMLVKRAYTTDEFARLARESRFGDCQINTEGLGLEVRLTRPARSVVPAARSGIVTSH